MTRILAAAALAAALPFAALADNHGGGVDQLKAEIMTATETMGMEIDLDALTDEQIVEISEVLSSNDDMALKEQKVMEITGQ